MSKVLRKRPSISSLSDYIIWSRECSKDFGIRTATLNPWYRGHGDSNWPLKPSLYRGEFEPTIERELIRDFRSHAAEFLDARSRTDIDWLFIAQHHGVPTWLLDWTENPLVALYFACSNYHEITDACVWALNAWELNKTTIGRKSVPSTDANIFKDYVIDIGSEDVDRRIVAKDPMAVRPYHRFRRSNAQAGCFTVHGSAVQGIDKSRFVRRNLDACLQCVVITGKYKLSLLRELYAIGVHHAALFQSLDSISESIKFRYSKNYFSFRLPGG